ncbi:periplasmic protein [Klebsiella pneumoniae]|nr:periplasmic protein [Klebsiella pneumoniae]
MKKLALAMACLFAVGVAQADDKGGFSQDAAPPPPHKLDDGYRGVEDGRIMTVEQGENHARWRDRFAARQSAQAAGR